MPPLHELFEIGFGRYSPAIRLDIYRYGSCISVLTLHLPWHVSVHFWKVLPGSPYLETLSPERDTSAVLPLKVSPTPPLSLSVHKNNYEQRVKGSASQLLCVLVLNGNLHKVPHGVSNGGVILSWFKFKFKKTLIIPQGAILLCVDASLSCFPKKCWCVNRFGRMVEKDHLYSMRSDQSVLTYWLPHLTAEIDGLKQREDHCIQPCCSRASLPSLVISGLHFSPNGGRFWAAGRSSSMNTPCGIGMDRLKPTGWAVSTVRLCWHVAYTSRLRTGSDGTLLPYGSIYTDTARVSAF